MRYKIFQANSIIWLIVLGLEMIFPKTSMIYTVARMMGSINIIVFLFFVGFVVGDYLKKNYSEDETEY